MSKNNPSQPVVVEYLYNAPVERVWSAITDKDEMKQWYFNLKEFRPEVGFKFGFDVEHKGFVYKHRCKITKVIPHKTLAYTWRYEGYEGDSEVTFHLFPEGAKTRVKLTHTGLETFPQTAAFAKKNFLQGWISIMGTSLKKYVQKADKASKAKAVGKAMVITRTIDASRERIWNALTDPKQVSQWWGPDGFTTTMKKMDVKPGGTWQHTMHGPDGTNYPNKSVFIEVKKPERLVFAHAGGKEKGKGAHFVSTWSLQKAGKKTKVTIRGVFPTVKDLQHVIKEYNALEGGKQTLGRLDRYLKARG